VVEVQRLADGEAVRSLVSDGVELGVGRLRCHVHDANGYCPVDPGTTIGRVP
jgi:hypothetical protein